MLYQKDFCTELFSGYSLGSSALIIFPSSLTSYAKDNETIKPDVALPYLKELGLDFQKKCDLVTNKNIEETIAKLKEIKNDVRILKSIKGNIPLNLLLPDIYKDVKLLLLELEVDNLSFIWVIPDVLLLG